MPAGGVVQAAATLMYARYAASSAFALRPFTAGATKVDEESLGGPQPPVCCPGAWRPRIRLRVAPSRSRGGEMAPCHACLHVTRAPTRARTGCVGRGLRSRIGAGSAVISHWRTAR